MRRLVVLVLLAAAVACGPAAAAGAAVPAHPLGNFTVNHYDGLTLLPRPRHRRGGRGRRRDPHAPGPGRVDADHDGRAGPAETAAYARGQCARLGQAVSLAVEGHGIAWRVTSSSYVYVPGAAGLRTSRLTCALSVDAALGRAASVRVADGFRGDRVGWHEISATGRGVRLDGSPVPQHSVSDELRHYPGDLLSSPLDVRSATLRAAPGEGSSVRGLPGLPSAGIFARTLNRLTGYFDSLVGARHLTVPIGVLALLLAIVLGASHAAMPGHGKTVMAAYIAGRRGRMRDAVTVGVTVTLTHTGGVLVLGFLLSVSASLAGESLLSWLGVVSGALVMAIGLGLARSAWRARRTPTAFETEPIPAGALVAAGGGSGTHVHDHVHEHDHVHHHGHGNGHHHGQGHGHEHRFGRAGLIGLGVSGGLVPSPSALVVLLGAIALGRTVFGVALVLGYGLGMAGTLTAAGLLLVRVRGLLDRLPAGRRASRLTRYTPILTAALVTVVGAGLALRGLTGSV